MLAWLARLGTYIIERLPCFRPLPSYYLFFRVKTIAIPYIHQLLVKWCIRIKLLQLFNHFFHHQFFAFFESLHNSWVPSFNWNICPYFLQFFIKVYWDWYYSAQIFWSCKPSNVVGFCFLFSISLYFL